MQKTYDPTHIEQETYQQWENTHCFKASGKGTPYCIALPPPNVTGTLHLGHAFQTTLMDALIRYHRMQGDNTLWQTGMDHAGIATQMVVERQLLAQNVTRHDVGRESFVAKIWDWKAQSGGTILKQLRRMGASADWSRSRFTMDEGLSQAVQKVFIQLYEEGLIYRGKRLVNWDPALHTAISDLEVVNQEEAGFLWHIRYPLTDGSGHLVVATTRPETMLGDTAIAVHPEDQRFQHLVGKTVSLPLTDRSIPIIADDYVDQSFGTGCVKITPAHDFNDYAVGKRHDLPLINVLTFDAKINQNAPEKYQGMDRFAARKAMIADLEAANLIEKIENYTLKIPRGDRSHAVIEPWLTDQWFVKIAPLAKPAIEAVESGKITFIPENWSNTYFQWMRNIEDWCISRQLWWGHRIPAWYDADGNIYVGHDEAEIRGKYNLSASCALTQDADVLDTWFSSALWPFSTLGWPEQTPELATFYPTNVLVTGFDIIFFWVARMIMFGLKFMGDVPFREIYITGLIRDPEGQKMSKSKGNILDPLDLIDGISLNDLLEKRTASLMQPQMQQKVSKQTQKHFPEGIAAHGTDALRFTLCSLATMSRDICFDLGRLEGHRNFCNKLWNATRYVLMQMPSAESKSVIPAQAGIQSENPHRNIADQWILSHLQTTIEKAHEHFANYRFDLLAQLLHDFTWHAYCDWYVELSKPILMDENADPALQAGTRQTLLSVLETLLRLLHPIMPFITEHLWQQVAPLCGINDSSIMLQSYPTVQPECINLEAEQDVQWIQEVIVAIRNIRGEMNISPAKPIPLLLNKGNAQDKVRITTHAVFLTKLAKLSKLEWTETNKLPPSATALVDTLELHIPIAGLIDIEAEKTRLQKNIDALRKDQNIIEKKLKTPNFIEKAPAAIVEKEKHKIAKITAELQKREQQLQQLEKNM